MSDVTGSCHCGGVQVTVPEMPADVFQCNCSLCSKTGWTGGYFHPDEVTIKAADELLVPYVQGDRTIAVWHCGRCGIATHWTPKTAPPDRMGVNMRIFASELWRDIPVTAVDGASF